MRKKNKNPEWVFIRKIEIKFGAPIFNLGNRLKPPLSYYFRKTTSVLDKMLTKKQKRVKMKFRR